MAKNIIRLTESDLHRIVKESVQKILRERWYPSEEDDISDYSYGSIMKMEVGGYLDELAPEIIQTLQSVKDENIESEQSYVSVLVRNVQLTRDEHGFVNIIIEVAVSAPNMPTNDIEEEAKEQVWLWFENKTGERITNLSIVDEEDVFDRRG
jgi:hypothetical protein